jgi:hypothetical protein
VRITVSERRVVVYYDYNEDDDPEPETWGFAEVWREDDGALAYNELDETFQDSFLELETTARRMFVAVQSQETLDLSVDPPVLRPRYEIRRPESAPISPLVGSTCRRSRPPPGPSVPA